MKNFRVSIPSSLRPTFIAAALYSETLEPHQKFGAGLMTGFFVSIPLGVLFAWRASGQLAQNAQNHFNGQGLIAHNRAVFSALSAMRGHDNPQHFIVD